MVCDCGERRAAADFLRSRIVRCEPGGAAGGAHGRVSQPVRAEIERLSDIKGHYVRVLRDPGTISQAITRSRVQDSRSVPGENSKIQRREKDSIGGMEDQANAGKILGDSQARGKVVFVSVHQALRVTQLATDENGRNAIVEARNSSCCAIRGHSTWWGCPRSLFPVVSPKRVCRSVCRSLVRAGVKRPFFGWPMPTSKRRSGTSADRI